MELDPDERRALIESLIASLDDDDFDVPPSPAWEAEISRRVEEIEAGTAKFIPGSVVFEKARAIVNAAKAAQIS